MRYITTINFNNFTLICRVDCFFNGGLIQPKRRFLSVPKKARGSKRAAPFCPFSTLFLIANQIFIGGPSYQQISGFSTFRR